MPILLVDDIPANLVALEAVLASPEYELVSALSGQEALNCLEQRDFAVVLLDIMMPTMDGLETALKMKRADKRGRPTPIIFVTSLDSSPSRVLSAYAGGAVDFIQKPLEPKIIRAKVAVFAELYRARERLLNSELRAHERTLFEAMPQLGWVANTDGWINYYNQRWYEYTGTTPDQMEGWGWQAVHDPAVLPSVMERWRAAIASGEPFQMSFPLRRGDGVFRLFMTHATPLRDSRGSVVRWIGINTDIDDQLRAEAALAHERQAVQKRIEALFNDAPAAIALLRGPDFVIEFANDRVIELWQRSNASEVVGKPLLEALPELQGQGFDDLLRRVMTTGKPFFGNETPATFLRGGKPFTVFFSFVYVPTRNAQGTIDGVSVFAFDVTPQVLARSRAELGARVGRAFVASESLAEQLRRCCEALVSMGAVFARVWTYDATHEVLELRASAGMYTHTNGAHARVPFGSLKIGRIAQTRQPYLTNRVIGDPYIDQEWAKREKMAAFAGYPLVVGDRLVGVVALFAKDELSGETLTALSTVADQIALGIERDAGERFRELFIGILGHDLRNPLNAVLMATHLLLPQAAEAQKRSLGRIQTSAKRMERMITQVLDFTRARSGGGIPLSREPADLCSICKHAIEELAAMKPEPPIEFAGGSGDAHGLWDADRMAQLFSNLIGNALTYGRHDAPIRITLDATDDEVRFTVENLGAPIPAELLPYLFDPFRRARHVKTKGTQGLGLGLFISHEIVSAHGGSITVQSTESGGTIFTVVLPKQAVRA